MYLKIEDKAIWIVERNSLGQIRRAERDLDAHPIGLESDIGVLNRCGRSVRCLRLKIEAGRTKANQQKESRGTSHDHLYLSCVTGPLPEPWLGAPKLACLKAASVNVHEPGALT
jgi:hypothetical protein